MSRRTFSAACLLISAILYSTYYLCSTLLEVGKITVETANYSQLSSLVNISKVSFAVGIIYLIISEIIEIKNKKIG
ncbi:hypothetical protein [Paenibacillus sp. UMB4589-SE434]|uniref:hypothetical protein n=1 Tax=Paenibacillus sp. UMB4589-SE434 TaxID=3046314 RepID=UPI002550BFB7|nr:hypothetical protein [Paenibacillus sp. UMB4589-SE434]MDK8182132.1 hypothetical protein [Paenibacillus sp. UMB4589-SE434]